jgi:hypothetical protein
MSAKRKLTHQINDFNLCTVRVYQSTQERTNLLIGPGARGATAASGTEVRHRGGVEIPIKDYTYHVCR